MIRQLQKENQTKMHKQKKNQFSLGHSPASFLQNRNKAKKKIFFFHISWPKKKQKGRDELSCLCLNKTFLQVNNVH